MRTSWTRIRNATLFAGIPVVIATGLGTVLRVQSRRKRLLFDRDGQTGAPQTAAVVSAEAHGGLPAHRVRYGDRTTHTLPTLAVLGDSWVSGVGASTRLPAELIARGMSRLTDSPVRVRSVATPSARAEDIADQVAAVLADPGLQRPKDSVRPPRIAIVSMGSADLIHPFSGSLSLPTLTTAVNRLQREGGYTVLVITCPNLGVMPGMRNPLRTALRRSSRVMAGSQWLTALSTGAYPVSAAQVLQNESRARLIDESGRFPTARGAAQLAAAINAQLAETLGAAALLTPLVTDATGEAVDSPAATAKVTVPSSSPSTQGPT